MGSVFYAGLIKRDDAIHIATKGLSRNVDTGRRLKIRFGFSNPPENHFVRTGHGDEFLDFVMFRSVDHCFGKNPSEAVCDDDRRFSVVQKFHALGDDFF